MKTCEMQEVVKCSLFLIFTCFLWIYPFRSKPVIKKTFEMFERVIQFSISGNWRPNQYLFQKNFKKSALLDGWENIAYWQKSDGSKALASKCGSLPKQLGGLGWSQQCNFMTTLQFSPLCKIEISFSST